MRLQLTRPLAFIDLETTGVNLATDRIVEIAIVKQMPDGTSIVKRKLINPQMPIPRASSDIHGITDEMIKDAPSFKQVANEVKQFLDNCDLAGYNSSRFDFPLLAEEFLRAGLNFDITDRNLLDVQKVYHMMEPRTLGAAYKFYCDKQLENAHSAEVDAQATLEVLDAQVGKYPQMGNSVEAIIKFTGKDEIIDFARRFVMENGVEVVNFGKHKGRPLVEVLKSEPQYYDWMMKGEFPLHTKQKLTEIFNKTFLKNK
ncbi:MAG: 3'-5' exonuclease [Chitinophagaceae bacterium]|nr:3'-5' exonuclease [Chitinophagaceae bacterium]MCW5929202.1 3'-5' exonuclease [Chitinophagaceae bacterium]